MHFVFIPYGERGAMENFLREMEAQKHYMPMYKEGEKPKKILIPGAIRELPFGIKEYIFPKENLNEVLTTMMPTGPQRYKVGWIIKLLLRCALQVRPLPKWEEKLIFPWAKMYVNIIPIGIRDDPMNFIEKEGPHKGWDHEAL